MGGRLPKAALLGSMQRDQEEASQNSFDGPLRSGVVDQQNKTCIDADEIPTSGSRTSCERKGNTQSQTSSPGLVRTGLSVTMSSSGCVEQTLRQRWYPLTSRPGLCWLPSSPPGLMMIPHPTLAALPLLPPRSGCWRQTGAQAFSMCRVIRTSRPSGRCIP